MGAIKAIETEYAGHRFRSRLEARWAVFFDRIGAKWEYEAQGFETTAGRYLPDFWLPDAGVWAEVKGELSHPDLAKLMGVVHELRSQPESGPGAGAPLMQLLLLGPVPRPGTAWIHLRFDVLGDYTLLSNSFWRLSGFAPHMGTLGQPVVFSKDDRWADLSEESTYGLRTWATQSTSADRLIVDPIVDAGYAAARAARFEHGESGAA